MKKYIKYLVVFLVLISVTLYLTQVFDSAIEPMKEFVSTNNEIKIKVGEVNSIRVKKSTYVNTSVNHPKHRLYTVNVDGRDNKIWLKIKASYDEEKKLWEYKIISIND